MIQKILIPLVLALAAGAAEKATPSQLLQMAKKDPHSASFRETLLATATPEAVQKGTAFVGEGPDFVFAVESRRSLRSSLTISPVRRCRS